MIWPSDVARIFHAIMAIHTIEYSDLIDHWITTTSSAPPSIARYEILSYIKEMRKYVRTFAILDPK